MHMELSSGWRCAGRECCDGGSSVDKGAIVRARREVTFLLIAIVSAPKNITLGLVVESKLSSANEKERSDFDSSEL